MTDAEVLSTDGSSDAKIDYGRALLSQQGGWMSRDIVEVEGGDRMPTDGAAKPLAPGIKPPTKR
jgi:hypothetical protein